MDRTSSETPSSPIPLGSDSGFSHNSSKRSSQSARHMTWEQARKRPMHERPGNEGHFIIAIDLGTVRTAVAFVDMNDELRLIHSIEGFPDHPDPESHGQQVPTVSMYPVSKICNYVYSGVEQTIREMTEDSVFRLGSEEPEEEQAKPVEGYLWGYQVSQQLRAPNISNYEYDSDGQVKWAKLLLDDSQHTREMKIQVHSTTKRLKERGTIKSELDVLQHFLDALMLHIRQQLGDYGYCRFTNKSKVEMTICVPVCWSVASNGKLCLLVERAMKHANFGVSESNSVDLFLVNEAEAGATHVLKSGFHHMNRGETFILVDCGGGTTDVGIYKIANEYPLRLEQECLHAKGIAVGADSLNADMLRLATEDLQSERHYLEKDGMTIRNLIERYILPEFERYKLCENLKPRRKEYVFHVPGLKHRENSRLRNEYYILSYNDMENLFKPWLREVSNLVRDQITKAIEEGIELHKLLLVGGGGDSKALRSAVKAQLKRINEEQNQRIDCKYVRLRDTGRAIAVGAVQRAMDKSNGPKRLPRLSIGVIRDIPWEPELNPGKEDVYRQKSTYNRLNSCYYIENTITWLIKKDQGALADRFKKSFISEYYFPQNATNWRMKEVLYASDLCTEDGYTRSHTKNRSKTMCFGQILVDCNPLRGRIKLTKPPYNGGKKHYMVSVLITMEVIDRNTTFTVRWPAEERGRIMEGTQQSFSLAAAFSPGTE